MRKQNQNLAKQKLVKKRQVLEEKKPLLGFNLCPIETLCPH
jgi:hypothetical protein